MNQNSYLNLLLNWIRKGRYLFRFIILLLLPFIFVKFEINETGIKVFGLILQIIGVIPLVLSLKEKSLLFGKDSFFKSLFKYIISFPLKRKTYVLNVSGSSHGHSATSADARVKILPKEDFKDIIRYFENEIKVLDERISKEKNDLNNKIQNLSEFVDTLKQSINKNIRDLENKMVIANVSSVSRDYFGIFTLVYGLILATIPDLMLTFYYWF